ncbi:jerky protein homolog-like [Bombus pascuorum]|uniref:jerky protein homolog-like n=1 Tax=Bombus pascuorum TaxID=65598 RepID=UPI00298E2692|nr:jerky protein homolog-like [Bombus pascuorum]
MEGKPRLVFSIEKKYDIVSMRDKGATRRMIQEKYHNVTQSILDNIYVGQEVIRRLFHAKKLNTSHSGKRRWLHVTDIERVVYQLYLGCRLNRIQMTDEEIRKKALEINKKLNGSPDFHASYLWLDNFKFRYHLTENDVKKDLPIQNVATAETFKIHFKKLLKDGEFALENVYNVVYTVILWKAVPERTLIFSHAKKVGKQEMLEDHVTVLLCANATGCHKLPALIIGSVAETLRLYNMNTDAFSVIYRGNAHGWMNRNIFNEWYRNYFLQSVIKRQLKNGRRQKTLLLLDNTKLIHDLNDLNGKDEFVTVTSIPLNISPLRQPMNCGIIASFKRKYRKELMQTLATLPFCNTKDDLINMHEQLDMWDCCRIVHAAWAYVDNEILKNAWDSLLKCDIVWSGHYALKMKFDAVNTVEWFNRLPGCERCDNATVLNWFECDDVSEIMIKIFTSKVIEDFENKSMNPVNTNINDEAGPSHSKIPRMS